MAHCFILKSKYCMSRYMMSIEQRHFPMETWEARRQSPESQGKLGLLGAERIKV